MQPIEPSMQTNQPSLDQPVKKLNEDSQEVVYHRSTATLPAQYAQQVLIHFHIYNITLVPKISLTGERKLMCIDISPLKLNKQES